MFRRVLLSGVAILLIANATVSHAQQADSLAAARSGARPGRASVGMQFGGNYIAAGGDYHEGAQPRLVFEGSYRYVASPHWRWQVSPYFAWNSYRTGTKAPFVDPNFPSEPDKNFMLAQMVGANAQLQRMGGKANWNWHFGVGPALYRVVVQNHRKVLKDPATKDLHQGLYLGATAEYGIERFMRSLPNTSLEWTVAYHTAFAKRDDQFPSGFNGTPHAVEFRFGGHYYYDFRVGKKPGGTPPRAR